MKKRKYQQNRIFTLNNPLSPRICPQLAKEIGLEDSILLLQIEFWLATEGDERGGHFWVRKTVREIRETFPFLSLGATHRTLERLLGKGYLVVAELDEKPGRSGSWYRLNVDGLATLKSIKVCSTDGTSPPSMDVPLVEHETAPNGTSVLIEKKDLKEVRINTADKPPRQSDSDDALDDKSLRFKIEDLKDPTAFGYDVFAILAPLFPSLDLKDFYGKWWRSRVAKGGVERRSGMKATLRQYVADLENFLILCVENQVKPNQNGANNGKRFESASDRNIRNLAETAEYLRTGVLPTDSDPDLSEIPAPHSPERRRIGSGQ